MKIELPLAITLLAAGIAIWNWIERDTSAVNSTSSAQTNHSSALRIHQANVAVKNTSTIKVPVSEIFLETIRGLRYAPPIRADLTLEVDLFGEFVELQGTYSQAGEGTPNARLDIRSDDGPEALAVSQSFDGRFYYFVEATPNHHSYKYVDLFEVTRLGAPKVDVVSGIKGWFGTGGFVPLLEQLQSSFDFEIIAASDSFSLPLEQGKGWVTLRGQWNRAALKQLLRDQVDPNWLNAEIPWERLPQQIPHQVEITIGSDGRGMLFPQKLVCFQYDRAGQGSLAPEKLNPTYSMKVNSIVPLHEVSEDWFRISSEGYDPIDATADYLSRIKMFLFYPVDKQP